MVTAPHRAIGVYQAVLEKIHPRGYENNCIGTKYAKPFRYHHQQLKCNITNQHMCYDIWYCSRRCLLSPHRHSSCFPWNTEECQAAAHQRAPPPGSGAPRSRAHLQLRGVLAPCLHRVPMGVRPPSRPRFLVGAKGHPRSTDSCETYRTVWF